MDLYRFYNEADQLLYIGISLSAVQRATQHKTTKDWWPDVTRMTVEHLSVTDRKEAERLERAAIWRERPIYNIVHNQDNEVGPCPICGRDVPGYLTDQHDCLFNERVVAWMDRAKDKARWIVSTPEDGQVKLLDRTSDIWVENMDRAETVHRLALEIRETLELVREARVIINRMLGLKVAVGSPVEWEAVQRWVHANLTPGGYAKWSDIFQAFQNDHGFHGLCDRTRSRIRDVVHEYLDFGSNDDFAHITTGCVWGLSLASSNQEDTAA